MEKPKRRIQLNIDIGADSIDAAIHDLKQIIFEMTVRGEDNMNTVSGGYSSGNTVRLIVNPDVDHDSYVEELNKYLDANKDDK